MVQLSRAWPARQGLGHQFRISVMGAVEDVSGLINQESAIRGDGILLAEDAFRHPAI